MVPEGAVRGPDPQAHERRGEREFAAYVAGACARLLRTATLLTAEAPDANPLARRLLRLSLARTYADWERLRGGDPYAHTRAGLATRFARSARRRRGGHGPLAALSPQARLVLVLRLYEGVGQEQIAALLGLPEERVRALCVRSVRSVLRPPTGAAGP